MILIYDVQRENICHAVPRIYARKIIRYYFLPEVTSVTLFTLKVTLFLTDYFPCEMWSKIPPNFMQSCTVYCLQKYCSCKHK